MATSGSGTGTPIQVSNPTPTAAPSASCPSAVTLAEYAELIGYDECAFWGISYAGQQDVYACHNFWTEFQRQAVMRALCQAQAKLEDHIRYPLHDRTWITGDALDDDRFVDVQPIVGRGNPVITRWARVVEAGVKATTMLQAGATVSHATDPATVVVAGTIGSADEVEVYYPDSDRRITPSSITYASGVITIYIPRCRLLKPEMIAQITNDVGIPKSDVSNFLSSVDVKRVYNDSTTQGVLVGRTDCSLSGGCEQHTQSACIQVTNGRVGIVNVKPANYADGAWTSTYPCGCFHTIKLNYRAGVRTLHPMVKDVIVRLAHSLMPQEPCGCEYTQALWKRDRYVPEIMTRERLNCPFGTSDGAYFAYNWARGAKRGQVSLYGGG